LFQTVLRIYFMTGFFRNSALNRYAEDLKVADSELEIEIDGISDELIARGACNGLNTLNRKRVADFARAKLKRLKVEQKLGELKIREKELETYSKELDSKAMSPARTIADGTKSTFGMKFFAGAISTITGYCLTKLIGVYVYVPLVDLLGFLAALLFFLKAEELLLWFYGNTINAQVLEPSEVKEAKNRAVLATLAFVFGDAILTVFSLVLTAKMERVPVSWETLLFWPIISLVLSSMLAVTCYVAVAKRGNAVRQFGDRYRQNAYQNGTSKAGAFADLNDSVNQEKVEHKAIKRELKQVKGDRLELGKHLNVVAANEFALYKKMTAGMHLRRPGARDYSKSQADDVAFQPRNRPKPNAGSNNRESSELTRPVDYQGHPLKPTNLADDDDLDFNRD
jgi:hypothetical protein